MLKPEFSVCLYCGSLHAHLEGIVFHRGDSFPEDIVFQSQIFGQVDEFKFFSNLVNTKIQKNIFDLCCVTIFLLLSNNLGRMNVEKFTK